MYPPYPYYPPPKRDNLPLILVVIVVAVIVLPVVMAAVLYVMVSGLIAAPGPLRPPLVLGPVSQSEGNATIPVVSSSVGLDATGLRFSLTVNESGSSTRGLPPPNGSTTVFVEGYVLRLFWFDSSNDSLVGAGDAFLVTGDLAPLPAATWFEFALFSLDGGFDSTTGWETQGRSTP